MWPERTGDRPAARGRCRRGRLIWGPEGPYYLCHVVLLCPCPHVDIHRSIVFVSKVFVVVVVFKDDKTS